MHLTREFNIMLKTVYTITIEHAAPIDPELYGTRLSNRIHILGEQPPFAGVIARTITDIVSHNEAMLVPH